MSIVTAKRRSAKAWPRRIALAILTLGTAALFLALGWNASPADSAWKARLLGYAGAQLKEMKYLSAARIVSQHGVVRVRTQPGLPWERPPVSGAVHAGESVRTLGRGFALLELPDRSTLTLLENTRLELLAEHGRGTIEVHLVSGTVRRAPSPDPARGAPLEFDEPEAGLAAPADSELTLSRTEDSGRRLDLSVAQGQVGLRTSTGSFLLQPAEEAVLVASSPGNTFEFRKAAFVLLSPRAGESPEAGRVKFRWNLDPGLTGGSPLELQLASDRDFEHVVRSIRVAATEPPLRHAEAELELPAQAGDTAGPWFWRVHSITDSSIASEVATFWPARALATGESPRLRLPLDAAVAIRGVPVRLLWSAVEGAQAYEVDLNDGAGPLVSTDTDAEVPALAPGRRSWRVRARFADSRSSPWSEPRTLTVLDAGPSVARTPAGR